MQDFYPQRGTMGLIWRWLALGVGVLVLITLIGIPLNWFGFLAQKVSPQNVQEQWRFAYDYDQSLRAIARQVCDAQAAASGATTDAEQSARRSQILAYEQNYERVAGEYNAHLRDAFRAGLIRPSNVPTQAPTLVAMKLQEC